MKNLEMTLTVDFPASGSTSPMFCLENAGQKCEDIGSSKIAKNGRPYFAMWKPDYLEAGQNLNAAVFFNRTKEGKVYLNATVTLSTGDDRTRYETRKQKDEALTINGKDVRRFTFIVQRPLTLTESMELASTQMESEAKASELVDALRTLPADDLLTWQRDLLASPASAGMTGWMDELPPHVRIELDRRIDELKRFD
jgi:hypothetical protein